MKETINAAIWIAITTISLCACSPSSQQQRNKAAYNAGNTATTEMMNNTVIKSGSQELGAVAAGVAKAIWQPVVDQRTREQPRWETTAGKSIQDCMTETKGVINEQFMRCRHGYQQYVSHKDNGQTVVLQERKTPTAMQ